MNFRRSKYIISALRNWFRIVALSVALSGSIICPISNLQAQDSISIDRKIFVLNNIDSSDENTFYAKKWFRLNEKEFLSQEWRLYHNGTNAEIKYRLGRFNDTSIRLDFEIPRLIYYDGMPVSLRNYNLDKSKSKNDQPFSSIEKRVSCSSSMSTSQTIEFSGAGGGSCNVCTGTYACSNGFGGWGGGSKTFFDPVPAGASVESITVIINGVGGCSGVNTTTTSINGTNISSGTLAGPCFCNTCQSTTSSNSYASCTEPSFYNYGANNTVVLSPVGGIICVDNIVVTITYCIDDPVITCPSDLIVECDGSGNTAAINAWLNSASAADAGGGTPTITNNYNAGGFPGCSGTGSQLVQFIATDDCGDRDTCTATITIDDNTPPSGTVSNQTGLNACLVSALATYPFPTALVEAGYSDVCGGVMATETSSSISGSDNSWTITYNYSVSDDCGNSVAGSLTMEGSDMEDPVANCQNITVTLDNTGAFSIRNDDPKLEEKSNSIAQFEQQANWVCDCKRRVPITISGGDTLLSDYQVKLEVPLLTDINSVYSNILFTSDDQVTEIDHWTQTYDASTGFVWVEIPSIPTSGTTIYMYYGNVDCGSSGDPDNVFEYFNDFVDTTGAIIYGGGSVKDTTIGGATVIQKIGDCDPAGAYFNLGFTIDDYVLVTRETRETDMDGGCAQNRYGLENSSFDGYGIRRNGETGADFGIERRDTAAGGGPILESIDTSQTVSKDTFVITELKRCSSIDTLFADIYEDDGTPIQSATGRISGHNYSNFDKIAIRGGRNYSIDYMGVAKFSCTPPTYTFGTPVLDGPDANCMNFSAFLSSMGMASLDPEDVDNGSSDNCDMDLDFSLSQTMFDCDDLGMNSVTLTVTDDNGNTDMCTATITVVDNSPPSISCPSNITTNNDPGNCSAVVTYTTPSATDNCPGVSVALTSGLSSGSAFPVGTSMVTYSATDGSSNAASCTFNINVIDNEAPVASPPADITVECASSVPAAPMLTATDNCAGSITVSPSDDIDPGSCPNDFVVTRTWTFDDGAGNSSDVSQTITVQDVTAPTGTAPSDITGLECITEVPVADIASITDEADNCGGVVTVTVSDSDNGGTGCNDDPYIVTRTYTLTDCGGLTTDLVQTITVQDVTAPTLSLVPQDTTVFCQPDIPGDQGVAAIDNCDTNPSLSFNQIVVSSDPDSQIIHNTWVAEDCSGNQIGHTQVVTYILKQPSIELLKGSTYTPNSNGRSEIGDTIFYNFETSNTGNTVLENITLLDPLLTQLECDSTVLQAGSQSFCNGYYIIQSKDINTGYACNSAIVTADVADGSIVKDTSDSTNPGDENGTNTDKTFTYLNQESGVRLVKTISETNDSNGNGILDLDDEIEYQFKIINIGNVTLYDFDIDDLIIPAIGNLDSLGAGDIDSTAFSATYQITLDDAEKGFVENSATVFATLPSSMNGARIFDVSDNGNEATESQNGSTDGDPTNDPAYICVVTPISCPGDMEISSCLNEIEVNEAYQDWLAAFEGGGCNTVAQFDDTPTAPSSCGGAVTITFRILQEDMSAIPGFVCTNTFTVIEDNVAPLCPVNWDIVVPASYDGCIYPAYVDAIDIENQTGTEIVDNCGGESSIQLTYTDRLIPEECSEGNFFNTREVIRTYTFTDLCGNTSNACPQSIQYQIDQCNSLNSFGKISINGATTIEMPSDCNVPLISVSETETGVCGYVEYMWLLSTAEDEEGNPYIPTVFNIGTIWTLIPDEAAPTLDPEFINQNTYYVRCARNFSCCDFGESNIVGVRINAEAECPLNNPSIVNRKCEDEINLLSPQDDYIGGEQMEHITDMNISAENKVHAQSQLKLDAGQSTVLMPGFEINNGSILEVRTKGCEDQE